MSTVSLRKFLPKRNNDNNNVNPKETVNQRTSIKIGLDTFCILRVSISIAAYVRGLAKYGNISWSSPEQMLIEKLLMKITNKS